MKQAFHFNNRFIVYSSHSKLSELISSFPQIGFINFTSVDINLSNYADADYLKADCRNIFVYGSNGAEFPLSCHSSGFDAKEIVIENLSMKTVTLDVLLKGTRFSAVVTTQNE